MILNDDIDSKDIKIQELNYKIRELKDRIETLENQLELKDSYCCELEEKLMILEKRV